jgi:hypothetical protein
MDGRGREGSEERSGGEWKIGLFVVIRAFLVPPIGFAVVLLRTAGGPGGEQRCGTSSRLHYSQAKNVRVGRRAGSGIIRLLCPWVYQRCSRRVSATMSFHQVRVEHEEQW